MAEKLVVLISGANQGIGYFAAQHFLATGKYTVIIGSRDLAKGQKAADEIAAAAAADRTDVDVVQLDVTSDESIEAAAKTVEQKYGKLDILANNAGISAAPGSLREQYQQIYNTNVFGQVVCTEVFLPLLRKSTLPGGKRIIYTSSGLGQLTLAADPHSQWPAGFAQVYRSSKSALNMLTVHYARVLEGEGFVVGAVCPGHCATNLNQYGGPKDPKDGAKIVLLAAEGDRARYHAKVVNEEYGEYPW